MTHVPHELADEFPEYRDQLHKLKVSNHHFVGLADTYHTINREIHRIEAGVENVTDEHAEDLKKQRLALKDEIFGILKAA